MSRCHAATSMSHSTSTAGRNWRARSTCSPRQSWTGDLPELVALLARALAPGEGEERHRAAPRPTPRSPRTLRRGGRSRTPRSAAPARPLASTAAARLAEDGGVVGEQAPLARRRRWPTPTPATSPPSVEAQRRRRGPSDADRIGRRGRADVHRPRRAVGEDHEGAGRAVVGVIGVGVRTRARRRPRPRQVGARTPPAGRARGSRTSA